MPDMPQRPPPYRFRIMEPMDNPRFRLVLALALAAYVVGGMTDLVTDRPTRWLSVHVVFEVGLILLALWLLAVLWRGWRQAARDAERLRHTLEARREERDRWRERAQKLLEGLGGAIDAQFREWGLTPAEREVALELLKGHSHKRIAKHTGRSERTVRQHAVAVYRKSGLGGRAELSAFFLEDLMLPPSA